MPSGHPPVPADAGQAVLLPLLLLSSLVCGAAGAEQVPPAAMEQPLERLELKEGWIDSQRLLALPDWIDLGFSVTAEPMINPLGGERRTSAWMGQTSLSLTVGSGLARPLPRRRELDRWSIGVLVNHFGGNPEYAEAVGALFPLQQTAYPEGFLLSELSVNRGGDADRLSLKAGIVPLNPTFVAAPVMDLHVHSAFNNTLNINQAGLPINPYAALGGIVSVRPAPELRLDAGWFDLSSTGPVARWLGSPPLRERPPGGSARLLQLSWRPSPPAAETEGTIRACRSAAGLTRPRGPCTRPMAVEDQLPARLLSVGGYHTSRQGSGIYGSATWRSGLPLGLDERLWIGAALASDPDSTVTPGFLAGGLVVQGPLADRPLDRLVLGAGRTSLSRAATPQRPSGWEGVIELGYQLQLNRALTLQPTLQWILHPSSAERPVPGILAAGLQLTLDF